MVENTTNGIFNGEIVAKFQPEKYDMNPCKGVFMGKVTQICEILMICCSR
jgi:hypothetical protein